MSLVILEMAGRPDSNCLKFDIVCLQCGNAARSQAMYRQHQDTCRCSGVPARCGCCGCNFYTRAELAAHLNQRGVQYRAPFREPSTARVIAPPPAVHSAPPAATTAAAVSAVAVPLAAMITSSAAAAAAAPQVSSSDSEDSVVVVSASPSSQVLAPFPPLVSRSLSSASSLLASSVSVCPPSSPLRPLLPAAPTLCLLLTQRKGLLLQVTPLVLALLTRVS